MHFKSGVMLLTVNRGTDVRFSFVNRLRCVYLFITSSVRKLVTNANNLAQTAAFCCRYG